jgi:hypothetical protein
MLDNIVPVLNSYTLINADFNKGIEILKDLDTINIATLATLHLNIRANTTPYHLDSVVFQLTGPHNLRHTEKGSPYALFGDLQGDYFGRIFSSGWYTLTAIPYLKAVAGKSLTIHFYVLNQAVTGFTLVNADNDQDVTSLKDGDIIDLSTLPGEHLNIRATVSPSKVGSVVFNLDGNIHVENGFPYAAGGDVSGNYYPMILSPGTHTLTATPYSEHTPYSGTVGNGKKGKSLTIHFTIVRSALTQQRVGLQSPADKDMIPIKTVLRAMPNPFSDRTIVRFSIPQKDYTTVAVYDIKGVLIKRLYQAQAEGDKEYRVEVNSKGWSSGRYIVRLVTRDYTQSYNLVLAR